MANEGTGGQNQGQGKTVAQGEGGQGLGATTEQLGENKQSYGAGTKQDTSGGQGAQKAIHGAQGQTGVLGQNPAQSQGQPANPTTGGPSLSQGLKDQSGQS